MKNLDLISEELFNKIRGRFPSVTIGNIDGKVTNVPKDARYFDFDYKEGNESLGKVSISVTDESIEVMYADNFVGEQDELTQQKWYDFLKELRQFSKKRLMKFDTRNINKSNLDRRDYEFLAANRGDNTMSESKMYGTNKLSYQNVDSARIVIKHTESVNPELGKTRTRNIGKIYIESADGERFLYPYKHLTGARAMARHVAEGGKPFDEFGTHIVGLSEEMNKLRKFKSYMGRNAVMAESLAGYMDVVKDRIGTVKKTIESLQKPKFYEETLASFVKPMMEDVPTDVAENWVDQLTIRQFNEELKDVFPYIYNLVSEATKAKDITPEDILGEGSPVDDVEVNAPAETYKVSPGDTIYSIAEKFQNANFQGADIKEAVKEIMMLNNISDPKALQVGQVLEMPYFMGTGPDGGSRGLPPGGFDKYGEEIENSFEDMMGQFADSMDEDVVEGFKNGDNVVVNDEQGYNDFSAPGKILGLSSKGNRARIRFANNKTAIIPIGMLTPESVEEAKQEMCPEACCGKPIKECKCGPDCEHCDCHEKNKMNEAGGKDHDDDGDIDSDDYMSAKDKAIKKAMGKGGKEVEEQKIPVTEFVLSLFDRDQGSFPKGETAVLTAIEKDYGEQYIEPAKKFIEAIMSKFEEFNIGNSNMLGEAGGEEIFLDFSKELTDVERTDDTEEFTAKLDGLGYRAGSEEEIDLEGTPVNVKINAIGNVQEGEFEIVSVTGDDGTQYVLDETDTWDIGMLTDTFSNALATEDTILQNHDTVMEPTISQEEHDIRRLAGL